jgi:hypothetical protein
VTSDGLGGTNGESRPGDLDLTSGCGDIALMPRRWSVLSAPLLFAIATAFGVSSSIQAYFLQLAAQDKTPDMLGHLLILNTVYWYVPALMAPIVIALALRFRLGRVGWPALIGSMPPARLRTRSCTPPRCWQRVWP